MERLVQLIARQRFLAEDLDLPWSGNPRPAWITLARDVEEIDSADTLCARLGITNPVPSHMVGIEYELTPRELHIPTVLDAALYPWFVSKPRSAGVPRAWNWTNGEWGMTEYVHSGSTPLRNARVRTFGVAT